jgi:hypothetical protein
MLTLNLRVDKYGFKFQNLQIKNPLSDIDRNHYDSLNLTVAQHPSETTERMMVRILVFCINAQEHLEFTGIAALYRALPIQLYNLIREAAPRVG